MDPNLDPIGFRSWWQRATDDERRAYPWPQRLDYLDLSRMDLSGLDLSSRSLYGADLSWSDLSGSDLSGCSLDETKLDGAILNKAVLDVGHGLDIPTKDYLVDDMRYQIWLRDGQKHRQSGPALLLLKGERVIQEQWYHHGQERIGEEGWWIHYSELGQITTRHAVLVIESQRVARTDYYKNGSYTESRYQEHPHGLLRSYRYNGTRTVYLYDPSLNPQEIEHKTVKDNGDIEILYHGHATKHREHGPVYEDKDGALWGWGGSIYQSERRWLEAKKEFPNPTVV
jgi:hypothetical protein